MTNHKTLINHCRALLSRHHEFARHGGKLNGESDEKHAHGRPTKLYDGTTMVLSQPIVVDEDEILKIYFEEKKVDAAFYVSSTSHWRTTKDVIEGSSR